MATYYFDWIRKDAISERIIAISAWTPVILSLSCETWATRETFSVICFSIRSETLQYITSDPAMLETKEINKGRALDGSGVCMAN